jgi:hypothetical protein
MNANTIKYIGWAIILLIGSVIGWRLTKVFTPPCPETKRDTISIPFDTIAFVAKLKPAISIRYKDTGSIKWKDYPILIPFFKPLTKEDTANILHDYLSTNYSSDTIVNDSLLWFKLNSEITQNKLLSAKGKYFIKRPTQTINNNPIQPLTNQLYLGIGLGGNYQQNSKLSAFGNILLKTKKDNIWNIGIDPINKIIVGTGYIKIKL